MIEPVGECRDELEIYVELAKRLGLKLQFSMTSAKKHNDYQLKPSGKTFDDLRGKNMVSWPREYKKYEQEGFKFGTETGKIELYSKRHEKYGYDPLPSYQEPAESPYSTPELFEQYPLILVSGGRTVLYYHGAFRQIPWLRELLPEPTMEIHPDTAKSLGIGNGEWVWIETKRGRCKQTAKLTLGIDPRVVMAQHGWWFPEEEGAEPSLFKTFESNINVVTHSYGCQGKSGLGAPLKAMLCRVYKVS